MVISPLSWDSTFFGVRIAKIEISSKEDVIQLASLESKLRPSYDLIYIFSDPNIVVDLENVKLLDKKVIFTLNNTSHFTKHPSVINWDTSQPYDSLIPLALTSGQYSRFKKDENLPLGSFEKLYSYWIKQSVNRVIANEVFCYIIDNEPKGLLTLDVNSEICSIGLLAVDEHFQHQGIGTTLIRHAISHINDLHCKELIVATQFNNKPACNLYSKCGFSVKSIKNIWHWWL